MQYTINQLRMEIFKEVYQVYGVFQDFFGDDAVDLQGIPPDEFLLPIGTTLEEFPHLDITSSMLERLILNQRHVKPFILVYWSRVKVTNENDKSIIIQDLYAKIELDAKGNIPVENHGFLLNRATYPMDQWVCSYLHSHIHSIPKDNLEEFQVPCLGRGPIKDTIDSLRAGISEGFDETRWMLFCHELSLYVTVESLTGVPYKRLEDVSLNTVLYGFNGYNSYYEEALHFFNLVFPSEVLGDFILYYLHNGHLAISYQNGRFGPGMPYFDYMIDISNSFIEYFNAHFDKALAKKCFDKYILYHAIAANGRFFSDARSREISDVSSYVGKKVCTFKGRDITLRILDTQEWETQSTTILRHGLAMFILNNILKIINYRYTNEYNRQQGKAASPAPTGQRVYYI